MFYITTKALLATYWIEIIDKKEFVKLFQYKYVEIFVVYIIFLNLESKITIYLIYKTQIAFLSI